MIDLQATTVEGKANNYRIDSFPDACPLCHTSLHPRALTAIVDSIDNPRSIQVAFQCTKRVCCKMFIGTYKAVNLPNFRFVSVAPLSPVKAAFSEVINAVSPSFVEIYNQAMAAEASTLHQLTGIGLRKALEFLIKDFATSQHPDQREDILRTQLGSCINSFLDDHNIKECAKRAAWLGNDETHYVRKWEDRDVEDLKLLIRLTVNWIENVLLTQKYVAELKPK